MGKAVLYMGANGEETNELKQILKELNYRISENTNEFDIRTRSAVEAFQSDNGLQIDGVVNAATWAALERLYYKAGVTTEIQMPENEKYELSDIQPQGRPTLYMGNSGEYVVILQRDLQKLDFYHGEIDGKFGNGTYNAVKNFQISVGLDVDGIVGKKTWEQLYEQTSCPLTPEPLYDGPKPTLRYGDSGAFVSLLQRDLTNLMYYKGNISGKFDWETQTAVETFQDAYRLAPDGIVGRATWHVLDSLFSLAAEYEI